MDHYNPIYGAEMPVIEHTSLNTALDSAQKTVREGHKDGSVCGDKKHTNTDKDRGSQKGETTQQ